MNFSDDCPQEFDVIRLVHLKTAWLFGLFVHALLCADAVAGFPYSDRYEAWSATHAFPIGAWYEGENPSPSLTVNQTVDRYRAAKLSRYSATWTVANRSTYVPFVEGIGMDWLLIAPTAATYQTYVDEAMAVGRGPSAIIVADEPNNNDIDDVAARVSWVQERTQMGVPHARAPLVYANLSALGFNIDNYLTKAPVDVLSYDRYPLLADGTTNSAYFKEMGIIRRKSLQYNIPAWMIQQAFSRPPGDGQAYRLPSESDMRFQAFSFLAHGGLGIDFFFYLTESFPNAIINHGTNQPSEVYYSIQNMAPEILNLGRSLPRLRPVGEVEFLGQALSVFDEVIPFVATASRKLYNIEGANSALVSYFKDQAGEDYFMLVNLVHGDGLDKDEAADSFTLFLDPSVHYLRRLNRLTGQIELLPTIDNPTGGNRYLTIHLEGGTGDLFQFPTQNPFAMVAIAGDFDGDGDVDGADFVAWQTHFPTAGGAARADGDGDNDGDVDGADFVIWQTNFPTTTPSAITISEPLSLTLFVVCGMALSVRRMLLSYDVSDHPKSELSTEKSN
jgi:hypothetical protein